MSSAKRPRADRAPSGLEGSQPQAFEPHAPEPEDPEPKAPEPKAPEPEAPFAYDGLDRVIHERARLGVLTSLSAHPSGLVFAELKRLCALTDGNLSRHLAVLEEAGLVTLEKRFEGKRPLTTCRLTAKGRARFLAYLDVLERIVRDAAGAEAAAAGRRSARRARAAPKRDPKTV